MRMDKPVEFKPSQTNILAGIMILIIAILVVGAAPKYLFWVLVLPLVFIYWCVKAKTAVGDDGIDVHYAFRKGTRLDWDNVHGILFEKATVKAVTPDDEKYPLPGVTFNSMPRLAEASNGRIPDAITSAKEAADGKMEVIDRNGDSILLTKEEYERHLAERAEQEKRAQQEGATGGSTRFRRN